MNESEILPLLSKFKFTLKKNCSILIDDIWDNYKFYAAQRDKKIQKEKEYMNSSLFKAT